MKRPLVMCFGVWDLLHVGHLNFLEAAARLGESLVVGVPDDRVVRADKGAEPVIDFAGRMRMVVALRCVTFAVGYYRLEFLTPLEVYCPEVLAVGEDWGRPRQDRHDEAEEFMRRRGGRVVKVPRTSGISTTDIIERVKLR